LCNNLGEKDILILKNHGVLTVGENLPQAFCSMYMFEKSAKAQITALSMGHPIRYIKDSVVSKVLDQAYDFGSNKNYKMEWDALVRMIKKTVDF
jgi:ribulose-5-phosphate 4-epimerase/fuculose-1-phosphate aldolase